MFLASCAEAPPVSVGTPPVNGGTPPVSWNPPSATIEIDVIPALPINITLDLRGRLSVEYDFNRLNQIETPLGKLSFSSGGPSLDVGGVLVNSIKEQHAQQRLLIVRIDEEIEYYEIEPDQKFDINIELNDRYFKKVRITNEDADNDTIIVELESVPKEEVSEEEVSEEEVSEEEVSEEEVSEEEVSEGAIASLSREVDRVKECIQDRDVSFEGDTAMHRGEVFDISPQSVKNATNFSVAAKIRWEDEVLSGISFQEDYSALVSIEEKEYKGEWFWNDDNKIEVKMDDGSKQVFCL